MTQYADAIEILRKKIRDIVRDNDEKIGELQDLEVVKNRLTSEIESNTLLIESIQASISFLVKDSPVSTIDSMIEDTHKLLEVLPDEKETVGVTSSFTEWESYITEINKPSPLLGNMGKNLLVEARGAQGYVVSIAPVVNGKLLSLDNRMFADYVEMCKFVNSIPYLASITEIVNVNPQTLRPSKRYRVIGVFDVS